jgi:hypothetical protein
MFRLTILITFFFISNLSAQTLRDQLQSVNACWANYPREENEPAQEFKSDRELIQSHLFHVIDLLQRRNFTLKDDPRKISIRKAWLNELKLYASAGVFPQNTQVPGRIPVFIDEIGTHCAVGYLMLKSGAGKLAQKVAAGNNYIYIHQLTDPEFFSWQARSGFTVDELALIQPSYNYQNQVVIEENQIIPPQCDSGYYTNTVYIWNQLGQPTQPQPKPLLRWKGSCDANGKLHGRWVQYKRDGSVYVEGWFKNGQRDSIWRLYFDSKNNFINEEACWKDGKQHGPYLLYRSPSDLFEKGNYENGEKSGEWITYMHNRKQTSAFYVKGLKHGKSYAYYHNQQDTTVLIATDELYEYGRLKSRKWYTYQSPAPTHIYEHISDSLYYFKNFTTTNLVREEGFVYLFYVKQNNYPMIDYEYGYTPYPPRPATIDVEQQVRTGKWKLYGLGVRSRIDQFPRDSAWLYVRNDSITGGDIFNGKEHFSFECLPMSYIFPQYYSNAADQQIKFTAQTRWNKGKLTQQIIYYPGTTKQKLYLQYRGGKIIAGSHVHPNNGEIIVQWNESSTESGVPMSITYMYQPGKIKCSGGALDTATRHGFWQFYDTKGVRYANGRYNHNRKTGNWEEIDTLTWVTHRGVYTNNVRTGKWVEVEPVYGTVWSGNYEAGNKKGVWILRKPDGTVLERKRYR